MEIEFEGGSTDIGTGDEIEGTELGEDGVVGCTEKLGTDEVGEGIRNVGNDDVGAGNVGSDDIDEIGVGGERN